MKQATTLLLFLAMSAAFAQTAAPLASSAHWKVEKVALNTVKVSGGLEIDKREANISNPRVTYWNGGFDPWIPTKANINTSEKAFLLMWDGGEPKYAAYEVDYISLKDFRVQKLPYSNLANTGDLPIWSSDEQYAAASGGNLIRLWKLSPEVSVKLLALPTLKNGLLGYAQDVSFSKDGKTLAANYQIFKKSDAHQDMTRMIATVYRISDGKLISQKIVPMH